MASGQFKEDRAEAAAKLTAKDIGDVNRERERDYGLREREQEHLVGREKQQGPGVMGSMFKAVQDTYEHAKGAVVGKTHDAANTAGEYKDYAAHKAGETKDATKQKAGEFAEKAREAKDATVDKAAEYTGYAADKAKEAKDATAQKAGEYKDYTAEKAKEGKDTTFGKLGELKDKAMGFFSGKKDETQQYAYETGAMDKDKLGVADDAKVTLEELKLRERSHPYEEVQEVDKFRSESDRGRAAKNNIMGSMGSVGEAIKSKLTHPSDVVEETRAARERGGAGRRGEEVLVEVEESRPGAVADTLKAADQMAGQINDVGRVGDEGTIRVQHRKNY
ncbi:late embryogenesis abundant protein ECP63-like [Neltuma alba]|uniref:late embryogenesis abundant protein ECP63-like n=1 Tax=Neltuma alba TaxID=207710 RepID=UPI0010A44F31|nr:late embryogenesis abundant protein ECP63-like [Prosopis alba]